MALEPLPAIDADIAAARTIDPAFYTDDRWFGIARERVFAESWQWLGTIDDVAVPESLAPRDLLPGLIDEPLLLARDAGGRLRCLSNVCTHRANLLVHQACRAREIRCGYHSRRFDLSGRMTFMPEFAGVHGFPSAADDLPSLPLREWNGHLFGTLGPDRGFEAWIAPAAEAVGTLPASTFKADPSRSRDYTVRAHWALYVENYLEGFHIPFVHAGLNQVLDYADYRTVCHARGVTQIGFAHGERAASYIWLFPNLMLNFYPWGLSLNLVLPQAPDHTRVLFRSFVLDADRLERGAGAALDRVEQEDEAVVEAVQRGVRSRLYRGGRYSPSREAGVHRFHRLLVEALGAR